MKKRALSILLALLLTLSLLPVPVSAAGGVKINKTNFPDDVFRDYVREEFDENGNGTLSAAEIDEATGIWLSYNGVKSFKGVELFPKLESLNCSGNELKTLDVSKNTALKRLFCNDAGLKTLDVSKNKNLYWLECNENELKTLDVSKNAALKFLYCTGNQLKTLDVSKNAKLEEMGCGGNKLQTLDVSKNTKLEYLSCGDNDLKTLDVSKNTKLEGLSCYNNQLTKLNISKNPKLKELSCCDNCIYTLNISGNPHLLLAYLKGIRNAYEYVRYDYDGEYDLLVDLYTAVTGIKPKITAQPKDTWVSAGNAATFSVTAKGECLEYQWYCMYDNDTDWYPLSGETDSKLVIYTSRYDTVGSRYYCAVTSHGTRVSDSTVSETARLKFMSRPRITTQPKNAGVAAGKSVTFKVKASGGGLKYQWYVQKKGASWAKLSGKTSATLKLTAKKDMNGYKYRCRVKNDIATIYSNAVKLTVK